MTKDLLVFQSMQRGSQESVLPVEDNYPFWETDIFDRDDFPADALHRASLFGRLHELVDSESRVCRGDAAQLGIRHRWIIPKKKFTSARGARAARWRLRLVEAVMIWNEPNNKSHWDFEIDPGWQIFAKMVNAAADSIKQVNPQLPRVLGGISPIDTGFIQTLEKQDVLNHVDVVAVHGFPARLESLDDPRMAGQTGRKFAPSRSCRCGSPRWAFRPSEPRRCRSGDFSARAELLNGKVDRIHWYSLYDLPRAWPATTRHREAEGSSYYRHFYMGLLREDGTPKLAVQAIPQVHSRQWASASGSISKIIGSTTPSGICRISA